MKKMLIISQFFAPRNYIASIRATKLAKYIKIHAKYNLTVITDEIGKNDIIDPILSNDLEYVDKLIRVSHSKLLHMLRKLPLIPKMERLYYSRKLVKACLRNSSCYDVVLSTSPPLSMHIAAAKVKKRNPNILWVADFRDPINKHGTQKEREIYLRYINNKASIQPDLITGISEGCFAGFQDEYDGKLHVIRNGFDEDDVTDIKTSPNDKFALTYTGKLYNRDLSVVFRVIEELVNEKKIDINKIQINYAGRQDDIFNQQVQKYNISEIVKMHGLVDRSESLHLQASSSLLLLASWNNAEQTGIITGKFYEYMMIGKPIVCVVVGNLPNSELKQMMEEANAGIVWEEANSDADYPLLKSYILAQYNRFVRNEPLSYEPNCEYIDQFNHKNITKQLLDLIENAGVQV